MKIRKALFIKILIKQFSILTKRLNFEFYNNFLKNYLLQIIYSKKFFFILIIFYKN